MRCASAVFESPTSRAALSITISECLSTWPIRTRVINWCASGDVAPGGGGAKLEPPTSNSCARTAGGGIGSRMRKWLLLGVGCEVAWV